MLRLSHRLLKATLALGITAPLVLLITRMEGHQGHQASKKAKDNYSQGKSTTLVETVEPAPVRSDREDPAWWARHVRDACADLDIKKPDIKDIKPVMFKKFLVDDKNNLLYCPIPKVASTTWRRILLLMSGKLNASDPMTLKSADVHGKYDKYLSYLGDYSADEVKFRLKNYFKFVFVREPFERLVSAFRNKFETNTTSAKYFRKQFGRKIIQNYRENPSPKATESGNGLKFEEFVHYLTDSRRRVNMNEHWDKFYSLCHPCVVSYNFIGKLPTIERDSKYILENHVKKNSRIKLPSRSESKYPIRGADSFMKEYYSQISKSSLKKLYDIYYPDFKIFNYSIPPVINDLLHS